MLLATLTRESPAPPVADLAEMPTERLEAEATTYAGHIAAATCHFLEIIGELDRRRAWEAWEARSMAHWVSWKCALSPRTADEHVRVALALRQLPVTRAAFARGELSYSKVRAITRFITRGCETDTVEFARQTTAAELDRVAAHHGAACRAADPVRGRASLAASSVHTASNADGTVTITARVPADVAARFSSAMQSLADELEPDPDRDLRARRVQAFTAMVDAVLEPDAERSAVEVVVHVDVETLAEDASGRCEIDGHPIATEAARRLACDSGIRLAVDRGETLLDLGRRARFPNPALRRAVLQRDGGCCRFPGCTQRTRLRIHHVKYWTHAGRTDRVNLIAFCPTHHRAVHEGGWSVAPDGHGGFTFASPEGRITPEIPTAPPDSSATAAAHANRDHGTEVDATTIGSLSEGEPMDWDWAMMVVLGYHPPTPRPRDGSIPWAWSRRRCADGPVDVAPIETWSVPRNTPAV